MERRWPGMLWMVLLGALVVRVGWGVTRPSDAASIEQLPDQREYLDAARNLRGGLGLHFFDPRFGEEVYASRMPSYPAFVAACGASARLTRVGQAFLDTSTVLAVFLLARRWLTPAAGVLAAAIVAVNPFLIYFTGLILSETLFVCLLTWGTYVALRSGIAGGVVLVLAALVRPEGVGLVLVMGIGAALLNRGRNGAYPRWWPLPPATTLLLLILAGLTPWAYRNHRVLGAWVWTTTNGGITAYDGFHDDATGASDQRFTRAIPGLTQAGEVERDRYLAAEAWRWARSHPMRSLQLAVIKALRTWSPLPLSSEFGRPLYRWVGGLYAVPLYVLVILGLCYGRLSRGVKVFLVLPAIYITGVHAMSVGSLRYRLPAEPPMAVLAVVGCQLFVASKGKYQLAVGSEAPSSLATGN